MFTVRSFPNSTIDVITSIVIDVIDARDWLVRKFTHSLPPSPNKLPQWVWTFSHHPRLICLFFSNILTAPGTIYKAEWWSRPVILFEKKENMKMKTRLNVGQKRVGWAANRGLLFCEWSWWVSRIAVSLAILSNPHFKTSCWRGPPYRSILNAPKDTTTDRFSLKKERLQTCSLSVTR